MIYSLLLNLDNSILAIGKRTALRKKLAAMFKVQDGAKERRLRNRGRIEEKEIKRIRS